MSLIETNRVDDLAHALFDDAIAPLARRRRAAGLPGYFPTRPDSSAASYFTPAGPAPEPEVGPFPGGGHADGLINALAAFWAGRGETDLAALAPQLRELADAVAAERRDQNGDVDIYCYTMF